MRGARPDRSRAQRARPRSRSRSSRSSSITCSGRRSPITTASSTGRSASRSAPRAASRSRSSTRPSSAARRTSSSRSARAPTSARTPNSARMGNYVPGIAVMNGPYFAETLEDVAKLRKAPTVIKWQEELASKFGLKVLSFSWVQGYRHFFTNKPVKTPEDLKGLRIRTPPAPIWQESIRALGATPVAMAFGEMYPGLQQKAIDGVELVYNNIPGGRFYEVLKYANETKHIMLINFEVVSAKWFDEPAEGVSGHPGRGMRQGRRSDLARDLPARGGSRAAAQGPRHDDREGRRPRGVPQGRRQGLRGARRSSTPRTPCTRRSGRTEAHQRVGRATATRCSFGSASCCEPLPAILLHHGGQPRARSCHRHRRRSTRGCPPYGSSPIAYEKTLRPNLHGGGLRRRRVPHPDGHPDLPRRRAAHARPSDQLVGRHLDRAVRLGLLPLRRHRVAQEQPDGDRGADRPPARAARSSCSA